jgi:hypothetical protein
MKQLSSEEPYEQIVGAVRLGGLGEDAAPAVPDLIKKLYRNEKVDLSRKQRKDLQSHGVREATPAGAARRALVAIGKPSVEPLVKVLSDRNPTVKSNAAWVLGELKDARTVDFLIEALKDSNDTVRDKAVEALGKIRDPRSIPFLVKVLDEDESGAVKASTEIALRNHTDISSLIAGLRDKHPVVRDNSAYILWLMTAKEFRDDADKWEEWWKEQEAAGEGQ